MCPLPVAAAGRPGGRLVAPMQVPGLPGQSLLVIDRVAHDQYTRQVLEQVQFVPLKSGVL